MIKKHVQTCKLCQEHNKQVVKYSKMNFEAELAPMKFISMDLIGEFHQPSSKGNRYALTVICMFTGYTFCIPIPNKMAKTVLKAYMDNVYCQCGGSLKILSDNGTEFKNKLMEEVSKELGVGIQNLFTTLQASIKWMSGIISLLPEGMHSQAHSPQLEWDDSASGLCSL